MSVDVKRARWVRKTEDGMYTIEPKSTLARIGMLCNSCGIKEGCPIYKVSIKAAAHADVHIRTCQRYVPILAFRKPYVGIDAPLFNTLRSGTTWVDRLEPGKTVAVVDSQSGDILRFCKVKSVHSGHFDKMLEIHAMFNHLAIGGEPVAKVGEVLRKSYGHFLTPDSKLTAIYLEPLTDENSIREEVLRG